MPPPHASLSAVVAALGDGSVSPAELVDAALAAAHRHADLGAFVALDEERARRAATAPVHGPLRGVPVAVKDMIDVAGLPTRAGSVATDPARAAADAPIVARLRAAGAIVIGKTTTHELAYGVTTPGVVNPRDPKLTAGGSSGGSAAAVAAGIVALALGTDTAGSVRIPAVCCGICGLIAPPGTLPREGVFGLAPGVDTLGPLVAEPGDLALAWNALAGAPDETGAEPSPLNAARIVSADRLGRVEPAALEAVEAVAARLDLPIRSGSPPPFPEWGAPRATVIAAEALTAHRRAGLYPERAGALHPEIRAAHAAAERRDPAEVRDARVTLARLAAGLRDAVGAGEILLTPALPMPPPSRELPNDRVVGRLTRLLAPVNAAGLAAVVVPEGECGVQLIADDVPTLVRALARL